MSKEWNLYGKDQTDCTICRNPLGIWLKVGKVQVQPLLAVSRASWTIETPTLQMIYERLVCIHSGHHSHDIPATSFKVRNWNWDSFPTRPKSVGRKPPSCSPSWPLTPNTPSVWPPCIPRESAGIWPTLERPVSFLNWSNDQTSVVPSTTLNISLLMC